MENPTDFRRLLFALSILAFLASNIEAETVANFVGTAECMDCVEKNIMQENAMEGLRVNVKCKADKGNYETKSIGDVDKQGNFQVKIPKHIIDEKGNLKQECFAELVSATKTPCPQKTTPYKLILDSNQEGKQKFIAESGKKIQFSSETCVSKFFLLHHLHKHFPIYKKPVPSYHYSHPIPMYKKPLPSFQHPHPIPTYKPPIYHYTPKPIYKKPCPPIHKKHLPPLDHSHPKFKFPSHPPIYKKDFGHKHPFFPPVEKHA